MRKAFRELLRSKYAALWSAGLAIIALVVPSALEGTDVRILFYLAYVLFTLAFFWTLAWWLTSETLASQKPSRSKRKRAINSKRRRYVCYQIGGSLGILAVYVASLGLTASLKYKAELLNPHGWLRPASDPTPPAGPCGLPPKDALMLFLGNSAVVAETFPHSLLKVNGKDVILSYKNEDGSVALSMDVLGVDGKIVARIEKNEITVNVNNVFRWRRPDLSTLWVEDQNGKRVLSARYLNSKAIKVQAVLNLPGVPSAYGPLAFTDNQIIRCFTDTGSVEVVAEP